MKTEIKEDSIGRQWGYLLLTSSEYEQIRKNCSENEWKDISSSSAWIYSEVNMVPKGYELRGRLDRVFLCVESKDEESIAVTFKQLENKLNA